MKLSRWGKSKNIFADLSISCPEVQEICRHFLAFKMPVFESWSLMEFVFDVLFLPEIKKYQMKTNYTICTSFVQSINFWCSFRDKIYNLCLSLVQLWCKWGPSNLEQLYCKRIIWLSCKAILSQYITKKIIWIKRLLLMLQPLIQWTSSQSTYFTTSYSFHPYAKRRASSDLHKATSLLKSWILSLPSSSLKLVFVQPWKHR